MKRSACIEGRSLGSIPLRCPSIVFSHGDKYNGQVFCPLHDGLCHVKRVPEMRRMHCVGSCYGWLILQNNYSTQCYLFNPTSSEKIDLPPLIHKSFDFGVLTYSPTDPSCVIVLVSKKKYSIIFCRIGDDTWSEQNLKQEGEKVGGSDIGVTSFEGKVYVFFRQWTNVIYFYQTFAYVQLHDTKKPQFSVPETCPLVKNLVECCGEIFLVYGTQSLDVFRLDLCSKVWVKVESISNQIFLVSETSSAALSATELGVKGNCIYFFHREYPCLYRFDMDDGTTTVMRPWQNKFKYWDAPLWMVPNCNFQMKRELVKIEETKDRVNKENTAIQELPTELFDSIMSHLFLDDWVRFRLTSKAWISINRPNSSVKQYKSEFQPMPWLMSFLNKKGVCNFYNPLYSDTYTMTIPELAGAIVRDAKFGWLLMSQNSSIFFYNPLTMEIIKVRDHRSYCFLNISFSSPPTSSDCIVFGYKISSSPKWAKVSVYLKKRDWWFDHSFDCADEFMASHCNPVFSDGVFYSLSKDGKLGVFYPSNGNNSGWEVLPRPAVVCFGKLISNTSTRSFIIEYDGEIFSVALGFMGTPVSVFKLDYSQMEWVRVESLGDKVAFLSHTSSMLVPAELKGVEDRIYLPKFLRNESIFYSLKTKKYHCFGNKESHADWINTTEHWNCTWIDSIF
ncbi:hypothetical protein AQUCO_01100401v1 [Aquilegia coerulea]|uniref:F-box domain-containing protein n=1 Tax=Aquilegia coerulea TaxID=218851 RepID=A0A2G5E6Z5_AQUCA|nr:hypothetical protein AQUCO_01100401v1 [Aquilegia coerulea]